MGSDNEYERREFWQHPFGEGWKTVTMPDGQKITFCEAFWNELLYGDPSKLTSNK